MRRLSILFLIVMLVSMCLPQVTLADRGKKGDIYAFATGVPVVVDNNIDVTYTGKTWKDAYGNNKYEYVARISQAPIYNDDGSAVDCSWHGSGNSYSIINNVFSVQVIGAYITTIYQGQSMSWQPIVMVDSKEYAAKGSPRVLPVDPINSNYLNNTLEWDYGVCVRRVRVIEGLIQETWIFDKDPKGTVWIKDNTIKSAGFTWAIAPYAFDANNSPITINQYKQVMASDMAKATYPVTIDPTEVYVTSASDGMVWTHDVWATAWSAVWGGVSAGVYFTVGSYNWGDGNPVISRAALYFDTSALPDSANITSCNLSLRGFQDLSTNDFTIQVQTGTSSTYPHNPLVAGDYDKSLYTGLGSTSGFNTSGFSTSGYNNISFNATGISWINKVGETKLMVRSLKDISNTANFDGVNVYSYEQGAGYRPTLYVTYTSSGSPTVTTNPATYVTKTTAQLNGYLDNDGGETCNVSFEWYKDTVASGWYSSSWYNRVELRINKTYVSANLTNFPVLITGAVVNATDTNFFTGVNANGSDIVVTASDGTTKLNRELVSLNKTAKTMELWANVSSIVTTANTTIYLYYNNSVGAETNSTDTWDANFKGVYHLNDNPNTSAVKDSTVGNNTGIKTGAATPPEKAGISPDDRAQNFSSAANIVANSSFGNVNFSTQTFTLSALLNISRIGSWDSFAALLPNTSTYNGVAFTKRDTNKIVVAFRTLANADLASLTFTTALAVNTWYYVTITYSGLGTPNASTVLCYINASLDAYTGAGGADNWGAERNSVLIGKGMQTYMWPGNISEYTVSNIVRPSAWVNASYYTLVQPSLFCPAINTSVYVSAAAINSTTPQWKNTGDSFYAGLTGLSANSLYYYRAIASNSLGNSSGAWVSFNTTVTLMPPTNVLCNAGSTSIALSWTKGGNSSYTYIRYKMGGYPTSPTDGNAVANQSGVNFTHTGLASGTSYYYRLWGEDGGTLSTTNVTTMCTTTAGSSSSTPAPLPTLDMSGATTSPNGSALTNNPLYTLGNQEAAAISVPQGTWWMLVGLGILIVTGLFIYTRSRNLLLSLGAMIIAGVVMANMGMFPIWILWVFGLSGIGMSWKELR